jgi:hypothetical protein
MQFTQSETINAQIVQLDQRIRRLIPNVQSVDRPGYRSTSYFLQSGMKHEVCYILCYDQKANLGFTQGITLMSAYPMLKGNGKTHRHVSITEKILSSEFPLDTLLLQAFSIN